MRTFKIGDLVETTNTPIGVRFEVTSINLDLQCLFLFDSFMGEHVVSFRNVTKQYREIKE